MRKISFSKMSGAGNDFILIDESKNPQIVLSKDEITFLCSRRIGIGADGVMIVKDSNDTGFEMEYFNSDGSSDTLCGNGARCAILYSSLTNRMKNNSIDFRTNSELYSGEFLNEGKIKFNMKPPKHLKFNFKIKAAEQLITASYADTGSPHVVINIDDVLSNPAKPNSAYSSLNELPVIELGREIRNKEEFAPAGTNVNFIKIKNGLVKIRTYERGVEDETLACGTGAAAAAIISVVNNNLNPPIKLETKSEEELVVDFKIEDKKVKNLSLTGSAKLVFEGTIEI